MASLTVLVWSAAGVAEAGNNGTRFRVKRSGEGDKDYYVNLSNGVTLSGGGRIRNNPNAPMSMQWLHPNTLVFTSFTPEDGFMRADLTFNGATLFNSRAAAFYQISHDTRMEWWGNQIIFKNGVYPWTPQGHQEIRVYVVPDGEVDWDD